MKKQTRVKRGHFPIRAPSGRFGIRRGENLPMLVPNQLLRYQDREVTGASQFIEKEVPVLKERFLRWYTPEHYARNGGMYFHKKDRKYYKVIDTMSTNPFKRYKFYKNFTRKKRFYTGQSLKEVKPYRRLVIDLTDCGTAIHGDETGRDLNKIYSYEVTESNYLLFYEAHLYGLHLLDSLYPLVYDGDLEEWFEDTETVLAPIYKTQLDYDRGGGEEFYFPSRAEAFLAYEEGRHRFGDRTSFYHPAPYDDGSGGRRSRVHTGQFGHLYGEDDTDLETLAEINSRLIASGLIPIEWSKPSSSAAIFMAGVTGPQFIAEQLQPIWLHFTDFEYRNWFPGSEDSLVLSYYDLFGHLGYERLRREPLRGTPSLNTFAAEMPETVKTFANLLHTLIRICRAIKRKDLKGAIKQVELGQRFLKKGSLSLLDLSKAAVSLDFLWKFGIKPFIEDLKSIADLGRTFGESTYELGLTRRFRYNWKDLPWADQRLEYSTEAEFEVVHGGVPVTGTSIINLRAYVDVEYGARIKIKDPINFFIESCGLTSILSTAWELMPLSFVIDWFVDIGGIIDNLTAINLDSFEITDSYQTFTVNGEVVEDVHIASVDNEDVDYSLTNKYKVFEMSRGYYDPRVRVTINGETDTKYGLYETFVLLKILQPLRKHSINLSQLGTLAELIIQRKS